MSRANQDQRVLDYLQERGQLDPLNSWRELGVYRLAAVIHRLRGEGFNIKSERKDVLNRYDEKCKVANYILED